MPVPLYPPFILEENLSPGPFGPDVDEACEQIHAATKGWGANKQKVIDALATQDLTKRTHIYLRYQELYNKDLKDLMKSEFSGDFGNALQLLSLPPHMAECVMIHKACKGIGANVNIVWSVMLGRTNPEMDLLKKTFYKMYSKDLGKLLASELHGNMERLVFNAMQGGEEAYDTQFHTPDKAREDAEAIHSMGQGKWFGTDEKGIFKILCAAPKERLENINKYYSDKYGYTLTKAMEKELNGMGESNLQQATLYLIGMKLKPSETMANLIKYACAGMGTDELLLTCCLIRYQLCMGEVQAAHIELFGKTLHERVRKECGGKFRALLLQVLNAVWPEEG